MNNDLISRSELKKAFDKWWGCDDIPTTVVEDLIDNAQPVELRLMRVEECEQAISTLQEMIKSRQPCENCEREGCCSHCIANCMEYDALFLAIKALKDGEEE